MDLAQQLGLDTDDPDTVDVGQEHYVRIMYEDDTEQVISAVVLVHPHKNDPEQVCQGFAEIKPGEWEVITRDPLTIHPSFVCNDCGDHGIVLHGKWDEAVFESEANRHEMPVWLRFAMMSFLDSHEEINHYYRRPNPDWSYRSIMDMVLGKEWAVVAEWLEKEYQEYIERD